MSLRPRSARFWMLFVLFAFSASCRTEVATPEEPSISAEQPTPELPPEPAAEPEPLPPPSSHHMGREIATTMHWSGSDWLWRDSREAEESTQQMLQALEVQSGQTVCDLGAGSGYHALQLASMVGADGRVLAVDIQQEMLAMLRERAQEAGVTNIETILGGVADPLLPPASCDFILMVDVYHEISYPEQMLATLKPALRPGGRVVLAEFRAEDPEVRIKKNHKMSKSQVLRELEASGFRLERAYDELPQQHLLFFVVAD